MNNDMETGLVSELRARHAPLILQRTHLRTMRRAALQSFVLSGLNLWLPSIFLLGKQLLHNVEFALGCT